MAGPVREGNLEAPTRHPLDWLNPEFYDEAALHKEMERVFDICHGCRRCVSLCQAFPTLFDLVDNSESMEVDGVAKADYPKVVEQCFLCDLCYMTKCPYVPPHQWNLDFPHLMLRAKAVAFRKGETKFRDKLLTSTDAMGAILAKPVIARTVNAVNGAGFVRKALQSLLGVHAEAWLPSFAGKTMRRRLGDLPADAQGEPAGRTKGKVALFATCYMNHNEPGPGEDLVAVYRHNGIGVILAPQEKCCGMPKLELGDLEAVKRAKDYQHSHPRPAGGPGLRPHRAGSLLRPDVQAGAAADVPRRRRCDESKKRLLRPVRISDAAPQGRQAEHRFQTGPRQGLSIKPPAISACRTSGRRPRSCWR